MPVHSNLVKKTLKVILKKARKKGEAPVVVCYAGYVVSRETYQALTIPVNFFFLVMVPF